MNRFFSTLQKEFILLLRDLPGLAIMFLMPVAMITIMALIEDGPFREYQEIKIPMVLMNKDTGSIGRMIKKELNESGIFNINNQIKDDVIAQHEVANGNYKVGIFIPENATLILNHNIKHFVSNTLKPYLPGSTGSDTFTSADTGLAITISFSPDIKKSFKTTVISTLKQFSSTLESQNLLYYFNQALEKPGDSAESNEDHMSRFIQFREENDADHSPTYVLNSVQHNVPAWTMFGMFFIVVSMAGSVIRERDDGSYLRLRTMPVSFILYWTGKVMAYLVICILQCILMLLVGIYLMPLLGLPSLVIGNNFVAMSLIIVCSALASTGYGLMVGSIFQTYQQASTFGAISVLILSALGGIWIPVDIMPYILKSIAQFSPLFWGLHAFQEIFLLNGTVLSISNDALKLLGFFGLTLLVSYFANRIKTSL